MAAFLLRSSTAALCLAAVTDALNPTLPSLQERIEKGECSQAAPTGTQSFFPTDVQARASNITADLFDIKYATTFKVVISHKVKEHYVLTQCGQTAPTAAQVEAEVALPAGYARKFFTVPLQSVSSESTVHLGFLEYLNLLDRITYISPLAVHPCWQKAVTCNATFDSSNETLKEEQRSSVDAVFMDCHYLKGCGVVNNQSNGVHVPASEDPNNLKISEYILFFSAFFNKEPEAVKHVAEVAKEYEAVKVTKADAAKPVVAWLSYSSWGSPSFQVSEALYKTAFVSHAGGVSFDAETELANVTGVSVFKSATGKTISIPTAAYNTTPNMTEDDIKAAAAAALMDKLKSVDVVIDETYAYAPKSYTFATFKDTYGLTGSEHNFLKSKRVGRVDGTISEGNNLDWYESRLARPDLTVVGLARILHPEGNYKRHFFRNIATNEEPIVLKKDECERELPVCVATAEASPIKNIGDVPEQDANSAFRSTVGAAAVVALAAMAM